MDVYPRATDFSALHTYLEHARPINSLLNDMWETVRTSLPTAPYGSKIFEFQESGAILSNWATLGKASDKLDWIQAGLRFPDLDDWNFDLPAEPHVLLGVKFVVGKIDEARSKLKWPNEDGEFYIGKSLSSLPHDDNERAKEVLSWLEGNIKQVNNV